MYGVSGTTNSRVPLIRPGLADFRMRLKEVNRFEDAAGDECCVFFGVLFRCACGRRTRCPSLRGRVQMDFHRGPAGTHRAFPQDLSHFETFSWLTPCPGVQFRNTSLNFADLPCLGTQRRPAMGLSGRRNDFERRERFERASEALLGFGVDAESRVSQSCNVAHLYTSSHILEFALILHVPPSARLQCEVLAAAGSASGWIRKRADRAQAEETGPSADQASLAVEVRTGGSCGTFR